MLSHMWLATRWGRPRPQNLLPDAELRLIAAPVLMIWGDEDPYGGPEIGQEAAELIPDAHLEVVPGRHAPFLDHPQRCGDLIGGLLGRAPAPVTGQRGGQDYGHPDRIAAVSLPGVWRGRLAVTHCSLSSSC